VKNKQTVFLIGHRGCLYEPEGTVSAFKRAIELQVDAVEFDVRRCKTGELVVINDESVDRLTESKGLVNNLTLNELKLMNVCGKEKFLTFQEALDYIDKRVKVLIEVKERGCVNVIANIINDYVINKGWEKDLFFVESFLHRDLLEFHKLCSWLKLIVSYVGEPVDYAKFVQDLGIYGICNVSKYVTEEFLKDAHERGVKLYVYVPANYQELELKRCINMGLDGIVLDYPDKL
jgi:glycerophosphoryl diester phosphodiesterase